MDAGSMGEPVNPWMMETGSIIFWGVLVVITAILAFRTGRLSLVALCLIGATTSFWQEFFGDWGAYVAWNPHFDRLPFWGEMAFTTPVKPLFIPFSWGWWFAATIPLLVTITVWLARKLPTVAPTLLAFIVAMPLFLAYQLSVEGSSVANGWWTYDIVVGPALESAKGRLPLVFPILIGFWAACVVALLVQRDAAGLWWHDRLLGVGNVTLGWKREAARALAFTAMFQVTMFAINIAPAIIGRLLFGGPSLLVP
jgi:hypothetical protein